MSIVSTLHELSPRQLSPRILLTLQSGRVPFIQGSPGIGKSAVVKAVAERLNLKLIDHRMSTADSTDLSGLPRNSGEYAEYVPFEEFPVVGADPGINPKTGQKYSGWLLFLDELNSAPKEVQAACYKLILDRMVGQKHLHPDVYMVAAGNLATDRAIVNQLSSATRSRLVHYVCVVNRKEFYKDVVLGHNYNYRVAGFLGAYPDHIYAFDPNSEETTFPCPRTWEMMSDNWNALDESMEDILPLLENNETIEDWMAPTSAGCVGSAVGEKFVQFSRAPKDLPTIEDIERDPRRAPMPGSSDARFAAVTMLFMGVTVANLPKLSIYLQRIPDVEFEMMFYRQVLTRHPEWRHEANVTDMLVRLATLES